MEWKTWEGDMQQMTTARIWTRVAVFRMSLYGMRSTWLANGEPQYWKFLMTIPCVCACSTVQKSLGPIKPNSARKRGHLRHEHRHMATKWTQNKQRIPNQIWILKLKLFNLRMHAMFRVTLCAARSTASAVRRLCDARRHLSPLRRSLTRRRARAPLSPRWMSSPVLTLRSGSADWL